MFIKCIASLFVVILPIVLIPASPKGLKNTLLVSNVSNIPSAIEQNPSSLDTEDDLNQDRVLPKNEFPAPFDKVPLKVPNSSKDIIPITLPVQILKPSTPALVLDKNDLIDLRKIAPNIRQDIRYATTNNFMHRKSYPVSRCLLRAKVAEQLKKAQIELEKKNIGLKVFDCYRPLSIQKQMWKILPDSRYVANPAQGSRHNRASAVDLTLVDLKTGKEKEMPSGFDEFSKRAHMDYAAASSIAKTNRKLLKTVMEKYGFKSMPTEWWHYDSSDWKKYPLLDISWD
jgi:zinc D-Ala-D-Ala dipeptidase